MASKFKTILGCIADDYTGATDLAGLLARSGANVSLRMGVPEASATMSGCASIEVIALKIRAAPVADAVAEALSALAWLKSAGATRFFWKYCSTFDSTATGNIGPVAEAMMAMLGTDQTIYCPAFPENGRSVYMGNLFVGQQLLAESPMKHHPLTPMHDSNIVRLLEPQVKGSVGLVSHPVVALGTDALRDGLTELAASKVQHVVVDAVGDADLSTIAKVCFEMPLITGGSAVASYLPDLYRQSGTLQEASQCVDFSHLPTGQIVLSGSCSAMTRRQVAAYLEIADGYRLDPVEIAKNGLDSARAWLAVQEPDKPKIIYATAEPDSVLAAQTKLGAAAAGALVEQTLAVLAVDARKMGIRRFVVAGGETSGAVSAALEVNRMTIGREIVAGVPWTSCSSGGSDIALALKSGNFGDADFFSRAFETLEST